MQYFNMPNLTVKYDVKEGDFDGHNSSTAGTPKRTRMDKI